MLQKCVYCEIYLTGSRLHSLCGFVAANCHTEFCLRATRGKRTNADRRKKQLSYVKLLKNLRCTFYFSIKLTCYRCGELWQNIKALYHLDNLSNKTTKKRGLKYEFPTWMWDKSDCNGTTKSITYY